MESENANNKDFKDEHSMTLQQVLDDIDNKNFIEKDKYYVIERTIEKDGEIKKQSQYVKIDGFRRAHGKKQVSYNFHYGIFGYHEGFTNREKIRKLTEEEQKYLEERKFHKLPSQFYHSLPSY